MPALLTPSERLQHIAAASPEVTELARAASLSVRTEPELLRRLRLALFPRSGAWLEADLYFSALVAQRTADWIVLDPAFTPMLRESLSTRLQDGAAGQESVHAMRTVIKQSHAQLPFELCQEEDILWLAVERSGGGEAVKAAIDAKLRLFLPKLLQGQASEISLATARWFASASQRLPLAARETEAFSLLAFASSSVLGGRAIGNRTQASPEMFAELSRYLPASVKRISLWVALTTRGVHFSFTELPGYQKLDVPHTDPILLEVTSGNEMTLLHIVPGQAFFAPRRADDVSIHTVARDLFQLRAIATQAEIRDAAGEPSTSSQETAAPQIFIIARTDDTNDARRLYDSLSQRFGRDKIFLDVESVSVGESTLAATGRALRNSGVALVVIGPTWSSVGGSAKSGIWRKLDDANNFVRLELAAALRSGVSIIPVLVQGATMPRPEQLPDDLSKLPYYNAVELSGSRWEEQIEGLTAVLEKMGVPAEAQRQGSPEKGSPQPGRPQDVVNAQQRQPSAPFKYDLYISYAHSDDQPVSSKDRGWVSLFHDSLSTMVSQRLGREVRAFRDVQLSPNRDWADEITDVLRSTAIFIAVVSPSYLRSDLARRELDEFRKNVQQFGGLTAYVSGREMSRIVRVTKIPIPITTKLELPEALENAFDYRFYERTDTGGPLEFDPAYGSEAQAKFNSRVASLANDIAKMLQSLEPKPDTFASSA